MREARSRISEPPASAGGAELLCDSSRTPLLCHLFTGRASRCPSPPIDVVSCSGFDYDGAQVRVFPKRRSGELAMIPKYIARWTLIALLGLLWTVDLAPWARAVDDEAALRAQALKLNDVTGTSQQQA